MTTSDNNEPDNWERKTLNNLLFSGLQEQRRARRWKIFFKVLFIGYIFFITAVILTGEDLHTGEIKKGRLHTAVIKINGVIAHGEQANADRIMQGLRAAFSNSQVRGVILAINSPGGSPVQSRQIYNEIKRLRENNENIKVYAAINDIGTSGAYLVASSADEIYADQTSLVGSIGVLMNSFGFEETMEKIGVERRLFTAGKHKGMLDPFSPLKSEDKRFIQNQLNIVHQQFIQNVKNGRGDRLNLEFEDLFTGRFWSGLEAKEIGLIDGFGDVGSIARDVIQVADTIDYSVSERLFDRLAHQLSSMIQSSIGLLMY